MNSSRLTIAIVILYIVCQSKVFAIAEQNFFSQHQLLSYGWSGEENPMFERITTDEGIGNNAVQYILPFADGRMGVVTWRYVNIFDGKKIDIYPRDDQATMPLPNHKYNYEAAIDDQEKIWVKEYGRVWCVDLKRGKIEKEVYAALIKSAGIVNADTLQIRDIYFDSNNLSFMLTDRGIWDINKKRWLKIPIDIYKIAKVKAHDDSILMVFDTEGGVTAIDRVDGNIIFQAPYENSRYDEVVTTFRVMRRGDKYYRLMGQQRYCRIDVFDAAAQQWSPMAQSDMIIHSLNQTPSGDILASTRHGVFVFSADSAAIKLGMKERTPRGIKTGYNVKYFMDFTTTDGEMYDVSISSITNDWQGGLWIGTNNNGILYSHPYRYSVKSATICKDLGITADDSIKCHNRYRTVNDGLSQKANDSIVDREGRYWYATHDGIKIKNKDNIMHITKGDGLLSDYVLSLAEDRIGTIWAMTNKGVNSIIAKDDNINISSYGIYHGIPKWDILRSSAIVLADGRIAVHCSQGWFAFSPDKMNVKLETAKPHLVDIYLNDRLLTTTDTIDGIVLPQAARYTDRLKLDYQHNNLTLEFASPDYIFPSEVSYQWKLIKDGDDSAPWRDGTAYVDKNGMFRLSLIELEPGHYTIKVKTDKDAATARDGLISTLDLHITPPWWDTWYAYMMYTVIALLIIIAVTMAYIKHQKRQMEQKQKEAVLIMRIQNLMEQIKAASFADKADNEEKEEEDRVEGREETRALSEIDSDFVHRAITFVKMHLHEAYTVEQLAADMCMERTGLYKRLTALINQSPQAFIRSIKLNYAVSLLRQGMTVSEVSFKLGFNSTSHFSRTFSKEFGCPPSEYVNLNN